MVGVERETDGSSFLRIYTISRTVIDPDFATGFKMIRVPIIQANTPPEADQPGTNTKIATSSYRIQDADIADGVMWVTFNDACTPQDDIQSRSCIRLIQLDIMRNNLDTFSASLIQDFDIKVHSHHLFFPALEINKDGNMGIIFGASSSDTFPSLWLATQQSGDQPNTIREIQSLKSGSASYTNPVAGCPATTTLCRYGDYFDAELDPVDGSWIWVAGEYIKDSSAYSTHIARINLR
jgi:hypothetical protein